MQRDPKALKILFNAHWSAAGWRSPAQVPPPADLQYATAAGYMFPSATVTHDELVARVRKAAHSVSRTDVANAFLCSLPSRRLDWRSALGTYAVAQHFPEHDFAPEAMTNACSVCGAYPTETVDYNVFSFERHKWGGVRHADPMYVAFDLEQFAALSIPDPDEEALALFRGILSTPTTLPSSAGARPLEKALAKVFPSSKSERDMLLNILGLCGILAPPEHPGFVARFVSYSDREDPTNDDSDWHYPVEWWRAVNGINREALQQFFPGREGY